jgi:hypothetical protein
MTQEETTYFMGLKVEKSFPNQLKIEWLMGSHHKWKERGWANGY